MAIEKQFKSYSFRELGGDIATNDGHGTVDRETAEQKLAAIESQAYEEGLAQGKAQTLRAERTKSSPFLELLVKAKETLTEHRRIIQNAAQRDAVTVAAAMANRIIENEILRQPALSGKVFREALDMAIGHERIKIRIHPEDDIHLTRIIEEEYSETTFAEGIEVIRDRSIQRGGCLVETEFGVIDARIEQQLACISNNLLTLHSFQQRANDGDQ